MHCCYSANEFINDNNYLNSPARLLSILLPGRIVVGFRGKNSGVKLTNVFEKELEEFIPKTVPLLDGAVAFKNGLVIEASSRELYCDLDYMKPFIKKHCGIEDSSGEQYFRLCQAREEMSKLKHPKCEADIQIKFFESQKLDVREEKQTVQLRLE